MNNDRSLDFLALFSIFLNLENLKENQQQSEHQETILKELNEKFDRLERLVKELKNDGALSSRNYDDG